MSDRSGLKVLYYCSSSTPSPQLLGLDGIGCRVETVASLAGVLSVMKTSPPDVLVVSSDGRLAGDLIRWLRSSMQGRQIPLILLTRDGERLERGPDAPCLAVLPDRSAFELLHELSAATECCFKRWRGQQVCPLTAGSVGLSRPRALQEARNGEAGGKDRTSGFEMRDLADERND